MSSLLIIFLVFSAISFSLNIYFGFRGIIVKRPLRLFSAAVILGLMATYIASFLNVFPSGSIRLVLLPIAITLVLLPALDGIVDFYLRNENQDFYKSVLDEIKEIKKNNQWEG